PSPATKIRAKKSQDIVEIRRTKRLKPAQPNASIRPPTHHPNVLNESADRRLSQGYIWKDNLCWMDSILEILYDSWLLTLPHALRTSLRKTPMLTAIIESLTIRETNSGDSETIERSRDIFFKHFF